MKDVCAQVSCIEARKQSSPSCVTRASGFFTSAGDPNFPQNSLDPDAEDARSSFDVRHRLSVGLSYSLPFSGNAWLNDWQVHLIGTMNSGRPFTVALHPDIDQSNTGRSNLGFGNNDRPNVSGDGSLPASERSEDQWFDVAAFTMPAASARSRRGSPNSRATQGNSRPEAGTGPTSCRPAADASGDDPDSAGTAADATSARHRSTAPRAGTRARAHPAAGLSGRR